MSLRDRGGYFVRRNACSYRFYRKGKYEKYQEFNRYGRLLFEDYMGDGRHRKRRVSYDTSLRKRKIVEYDVVSNLPRVEKYFDNLGRCRIYSWVSSMAGEAGLFIFVADEQFNINLFAISKESGSMSWPKSMM